MPEYDLHYFFYFK